MYVKSVEIRGMNNVAQKTYSFSSDVNYLYGKNGAGKSTVLQAIQLALLGYIPGMSKKNDAIMRHANGPQMSVICTLQDEGRIIQIERSWKATKKGVACQVHTIPENLDLSTILGNVELPVFNFNEFINLSANKLKDWFISFLPNQLDDLDWKSLLSSNLPDGITEPPEELLLDTLSDITQYSNNGIEGIRQVNAQLKLILSATKDHLDWLNGAIRSLIYYDDYVAEESIDSLKARLFDLETKYKKLLAEESGIKSKRQLDVELAVYADLLETIDADPQYQGLLNLENQYTSSIDGCIEDASTLNSKYAELLTEYKTKYNFVSGSGVCPYTNTVCDNIMGNLDAVRTELPKLKFILDDTLDKLQKVENTKTICINRLESVRGKLSELKSKYQHRDQLKKLLSNYHTNMDADSLQAMLQQNQSEQALVKSNLVKAEANAKYLSSIDNFTQDKYRLEQNIEILKFWIKYTGENGIQTKYMEDPFKSMTNSLDNYLQRLFDDPNIHAYFNLECKMNSFNFGILRNNYYIPFDTLSSGEKCIFTLALLSYFVSVSNSDLNLILIDDLLDHLDKENIEMIFKGIQTLPDTQFILAGVKNSKAAKEYTINI